MVNRIASKYASTIFTGFDDVLPKAVTVGQILSDDITPLTKSLSRRNCGRGKGGGDHQIHTHKTPRPSDTPLTKGDKPTVFIIGGSQGSRILYETFAELLQTNVGIASSFNFFITLGKLNNNLKPLFSQQNVHCFEFLSQKEMGEIYQISDICLTR
jgi:UDP-N-acetylglucosamine:LPS N-acetylglucosamine transferase